MNTDRIGISIGSDDLELVTRVDRLGYDSVWTAEGQGHTAFGKLERWATVTSDIALATGIVNVFSRSPAAIAQAAATLDAHSNGRAILGLGVAHPGVVEEFHGMPFERPLARMAEYIELVRRYLAGTAEEFEGEFYTPGRTSFWDAFEPRRAEIPIYNAAIGPENIRLTGEVADGWYPNLFPRNRFENARGWLAEGADRAGRDISEIDVVMNVPTAVADDPDVARRAVAEHIAVYLRGDIPGYYSRVVERAGFEDDIAAIRAADSVETAAKRIGDDLIDAIGVVGTPAEATERLAEIRDAGVDLPIIRPPSGAARSLVRRTIETFAP